MKTIFTTLSLLLLLGSSLAQEQRLRALPAGNNPADYWTELEPIEMDLHEKVEPRIQPTAIPAWQTRYTLGAGDVISFSIYDLPDLSRENVQIAPDGTVSYLQAVAVRAQGLTPDQLRHKIEDRLKAAGRKNAKVIVTPSEISSKNFAIIGRVQKPGNFVLDRPTSILEGIALAEGIQIGSVRGSAFELADFERSFVSREGKKLDVDLASLYYEGDFSQNAYLEPGDYIYVASNVDNEIYVLGEVSDPGRRKMPRALTITQAIAEAGGFGEYAWKMKVLLIRGSIHNPETQIINMRDILQGARPDVVLENRDIIFVNKRPFEIVERVLDQAVVTFMQTVTAEALNQNFNPIFSDN